MVGPLRTPVGVFGGALRPVPVEEPGATLARAIVQRTGLDSAHLDDVVFAQSYMNLHERGDVVHRMLGRAARGHSD